MDSLMVKNLFDGKNIIVGITGSISAYKSLLLIRELHRLGAKVHPVLTPSAVHFVTPLSVSNLSKSQIIVDMFDMEVQRSGAWHIELAHLCDLMIVAPATATTIAKIANGICDNSLVTLATALPKHTPLLVAPAMDTSMWLNPATQRNVETLQNNGVIVIPPDYGELSSGYIGEGRLPTTQVLLDYIETYLYFKENGLEKATQLRNKFKRLNILVTAGPTYEKIDDVRFIGNFSSGKMGYALAAQSRILGAKVKLISGPTKIDMFHNIGVIPVTSAQEMYSKVMEYYDHSDVVVMASAVADFTPSEKFLGKFKKEKTKELVLKLKRTVDILGELGTKKQNQILVGFALEDSKTGLKNAWRKLLAKNCDMIVLNYFDKMYSGFDSDLNTITILGFANEDELFVADFPPMSKNLCSLVILEQIASLIN
ncbi:MAG: bifunctional phosphopantothenoylcysteine decarboxylase/phosphopantothenate--cysteine ligase CoaBC [Candidatus Kapaibacteriota bacterium]